MKENTIFFSYKQKLFSLLSHRGFKKYFANTSWLFLEKIFRMLISFFISVLIARYLGPEKFGILSYAQSFVGLFAAFATLGLEGVLIREIIKNPEKENKILGTALFLRFIGFNLTILAIVLSFLFISNDIFVKILIIIITFSIFFKSFSVIDLYFQAKVLGRYSFLANSTAFFTSSLLKLYFIFTGAPLIAFAFSILFDSFVAAVSYLYWFYKVNKTSINGLFKFDVHIAKSLLKDSFFFMLTAFIIGIYTKIDQVMIKNMLGNKEVSYYSIASQLVLVWYFIPVIISKSLYPAIENAKKISRKIYISRLEILFIIMSFISFLIIAIIELFREDIIVMLYGKDFMYASNIIAIYAISLIFSFQRIASEYFVVSENLKFFEIFKTSLGMILNVILNFVLIKKYGAIGAAYATIASVFLAGYLVYILHPKTRKIFILITKSILLINIYKLLTLKKMFG